MRPALRPHRPLRKSSRPPGPLASPQDPELAVRHPLRRIAPAICVLASAAFSLAAAPAASAQAPAPATSTERRDPPPPLPAEVLKDSKVIAQGEALWQEQCTHCHGSKAYPGKAPKLEPRRYKPDFVWDRVHNGFRDMPAWKGLYTPEQEIAIVAYVLSDEFWP
jgi:mono/diheme cytochrome c family protein